jgi:hypothetical protein
MKINFENSKKRSGRKTYVERIGEEGRRRKLFH